MGTYVVGDIHGCYKEFMELKDKIEAQDADAHIILVGDVIDRGADSMKMLRWAIDNCNVPGSRYEMILGNHEYEKMEMLESYLNEYRQEYYQRKAENPDKESGLTFVNRRFPDHYYFDTVLEHEKVTFEEIGLILGFMMNLPVYKELDLMVNGRKQHYIIVHGGLRSDFLNKNETVRKSAFTTAGRRREAMKNGHDSVSKVVWDRYSADTNKTIIVYGHTPTCEDRVGRGRILFWRKQINVDCGCVFHGTVQLPTNLAAIRLEDMEEFYLYQPWEATATNADYKSRIFDKPVRRKDDWDF